MGATTFQTISFGENAKVAFYEAIRRAQYDHGHSGYTGTIAEKREYVMITVPDKVNPADYADELIDKCDPRIDDKWGPAGCIQLDERSFLFFGWASC